MLEGVKNKISAQILKINLKIFSYLDLTSTIFWEKNFLDSNPE